MNFYYDPILGLQYTGYTEFFVSVDMSKIKENINVENFIRKWKEYKNTFGISISNSVEEYSYQKITEYYL